MSCLSCGEGGRGGSFGGGGTDGSGFGTNPNNSGGREMPSRKGDDMEVCGGKTRK